MFKYIVKRRAHGTYNYNPQQPAVIHSLAEFSSKYLKKLGTESRCSLLQFNGILRSSIWLSSITTENNSFGNNWLPIYFCTIKVHLALLHISKNYLTTSQCLEIPGLLEILSRNSYVEVENSYGNVVIIIFIYTSTKYLQSIK